MWVKSGQNKTKTKQNEASGLVGEFIVSMGSRLESQYLESLGTEVSILGCFLLIVNDRYVYHSILK